MFVQHGPVTFVCRHKNEHHFCHIDDVASKVRSTLEKDISAAEDIIKRAEQEISTSRLTLKKTLKMKQTRLKKILLKGWIPSSMRLMTQQIPI